MTMTTDGEQRGTGTGLAGTNGVTPGIVAKAAEKARSGIERTSTEVLARTAAEQVRAHVLMARTNPRDWELVREDLLKHCARYRFADIARYRVPRGRDKPVQGPSIHFARTVMGSVGNLSDEAQVLGDDETQRHMRVCITDFERNTRMSEDVVVQKLVERSFVPDGEVPVGQRVGSRGQTVYLLRPSEDEFLIRLHSVCSRIHRNLILSLLPRDILDDCMDRVVQTLAKEDAGLTPEEQRKRVFDSFAALRVPAKLLKEYLGHDNPLSADETEELRGLKTAIRDGEVTFADALKRKLAERAPAEPAEGEAAAGGAGEALERKAQRKVAASAPAAAPSGGDPPAR
jgi:hypothetical protein